MDEETDEVNLEIGEGEDGDRNELKLENQELRASVAGLEARLKKERAEFRARVPFLEAENRELRERGAAQERTEEAGTAAAAPLDINAESETEAEAVEARTPKMRGRPQRLKPSEKRCWGRGRKFSPKTKRDRCRACGMHFCASYKCHIRPKNANDCAGR